MRRGIGIFARRGYTNPLGKLGQPIGGLRLHAETEELVRTAAASEGLPVMEYVRSLLELGHHGRQEIERRNTIRLDHLERLIPKRSETNSRE